MQVRDALGLLAASVSFGCQAQGPKAAGETSAESCEAHKQEVVLLLERLPERALTTAVHVELPEASLVGNLGEGLLLELSETSAYFEQQALAGETVAARARALLKALEAWLAREQNKAAAEVKAQRTLYVAAAATLDVRTLHGYLASVPESLKLRLLFRAPLLPVQSESEAAAQEFAQRLLGERDPEARKRVAERGYSEFAACPRVKAASLRANQASEEGRWPMLRNEMLKAVNECPCNTMDSRALGHLFVAEQRAGSMALGSLPLDFLRDARCSASMPLRSIQKLLRQIEDFDAEFAGNWQNDALAFDRVLESERLLNYFCDALPGETLAALQRANAQLFWRTAGDDACQAWQFEPLAPGAPMGTWTRRDPSLAPLGLYYWQGAEEIRLFGPSLPGGKATDERKYACDQHVRMVAVDSQKISLEQGHWYLERAACEKATLEAARLPGCVGTLAEGSSPAAEPPAQPGSASPPASETPDTP